MKLRQLLLGCVLLAFAGLLVLLALGMQTWQSLNASEQRLDELTSLRERSESLRGGLDAMLLLPDEPTVLSDLAADADRLQTALQAESSSAAERAARHAGRIRQLLASADSLPDGRAGEVLVQQLNIHANSLGSAIGLMFEQGGRTAIDQMRALLLTLLLLGLAFGLACVAAFVAINWSLQRPLQAIQQGINRFAQGDAVATIPLRGNSELAELAQAFNDMARQRLAHEAELQASEARFRHIARVVADAVWDVDLSTGQVWLSDGLQPLYRDPDAPGEAHVASDAFLQRIVPEDRQRIIDSVETVLASDGREWAAEYRQFRADGSVAEVASRALVVRDEDGQPVRLLGGTTDLTEQRALEAQLRQSQRLEAVGQLTGGIAHDFNNLLTVILGNAEELAETLSPQDPLWAAADMVRSAAERGAALNRRLLTFARRQVLKPERLDIAAVVDELQPLLRSLLPRGISLQVDHGHPLRECCLDATELEAALLNLVVNARDALGEAGTITLMTRTAVAPDEATDTLREYICVTVEDNGEGMPEAVRERVFEPFYTTKERGKGTGLGLSMVYGFITQSGGQIRIDSTPGMGTRIELYLPGSQDVCSHGM